MTNERFDFSKPIDRIGTFCTQWDFVQDRFGQKDLLPFTISDMDFKTAPAILERLSQSIHHGVFGYSRWKVTPFLDAISNWFLKRFETQIDQNHIVYGPSVMYIAAKLITLWSNKQDGIITFTPAYDAFYKVIESNQRKVVASPLTKIGSEWLCNFEQLERCMAEKQNTLLLLCNPHNPTGKAWTAEELSQIAYLSKKYHVQVISDEIHMDMVWKGIHLPWLNFAQNDWAVVTSASKSFNIPALTGAYALINHQQTREQYLNHLKMNDAVSSPCILAIQATISAYNDSEKWLDSLRDYIYQNLIYVDNTLKQAFPKLKQKTIPEATYLDWIDLNSIYKGTDEALQEKLIHNCKVAIMPGSTYGKEGTKYLRLNVACPRSKLEKGVTAIIESLK